MATHTLIHFTPAHDDVREDGYETLDDALEAAKRIDPSRLVYLSVEDAAAPNGLQVLKVERTESLDAIQFEPTSAQVTTLHNALAERPVARFATRTAAIEKTTRALSERLGRTKSQLAGGKEESKVEQQEAAQETAIDYSKIDRVADEKARLAEKKGRGGRKQTHTDDMVVVLKVDRNPKREGSATHGRFTAMMRVLKAGKATVADVLATGVTRGDLAYDEAHGYVEIVKA